MKRRRDVVLALVLATAAACGGGGGAQTSGHVIALDQDKLCLDAGGSRDCFRLTADSKVEESVALGKMVTVRYEHPKQVLEVEPVEQPPSE